MKKTPITSLKSLVIIMVFGVQQIYGVAVTTFSCDKTAEPVKSFSITCTITNPIENGIQWIRPDGNAVVSCSASNSCFDLIPGYTVTTKTSSESVLQIASVGKMDEGNWTCQDGAGGEKGCEIILQKTPLTSLKILSTQNIYSVGDTLEVSVDVQDYYCSKSPTFHLLLDGQRVDLDELPRTASMNLSGAQNISITVTKEMTGYMKLVFNCRDDDVLFDEKSFGIPAHTTEPPTSTPATTTVKTTTTTTTPSSPPIGVILGSVFGGVFFIIVIIGCCWWCCYVRRKQNENEGNGIKVVFKENEKQMNRED